MTDYTKLIERLREVEFGKAADAIEALQGENERLKAMLNQQVSLVEKCIVAMNANADLGQKAEAERDALAAELATLKAQELTGCVMKITVRERDWTVDYLSLPVGTYELFTKSYVYNAAPKALEDQEPVVKVVVTMNGIYPTWFNADWRRQNYRPTDLREDKQISLYAAPWVLEPLTDEQITALWIKHRSQKFIDQWNFASVVRCAEAAHGIGGTPKAHAHISNNEEAEDHIERVLWEFIDVARMFPRAKKNTLTWLQVMAVAPVSESSTKEPQ